MINKVDLFKEQWGLFNVEFYNLKVTLGRVLCEYTTITNPKIELSIQNNYVIIDIYHEISSLQLEKIEEVTNSEFEDNYDGEFMRFIKKLGTI